MVPNPLEPGQDFWPTKPPIITRDQVNERSIENISESLETGKHITLFARLTRFFSSKARLENESFNGFAAQRATYYSLKQPSAHLKKLCDDDDTKEWIETALKHVPIFLIIGFLTVTEAEVGREQQRSGEVRTAVEVSPSDIASLGVTTVLPTSMDSIGMEFQAGGHAQLRYSFTAPGERIIGVQYRKLKFNRTMEIDLKISLNGNSWFMFYGERKPKGSIVTTGDVLEVDLEESLTLNDLELELQGVEVDKLSDPTLLNEEFVFLDD